ncbi:MULTISPECIES: SagB/ThcOx family dehydrogenase [unclassified Streptomyces]|uniref:SagB/ThcOx family dehydrogenase n=1 Tax=unclassified Streptomyces TaxID=2593676 RepID=UPI000A9B926A|nr:MULTISPECIES: SagB/ThcOx family dehydrogenase [unclassified Streptomyces]
MASIDGHVERSEIVERFRDGLAVGERQATEFVDKLIEAGVLWPEGYTHPLMPQVQTWREYGWTDALIFHCLTEGQSYTDVLHAETPETPAEALTRRLGEGQLPPFWKTLPVAYEKLPEAVDYPSRDLADVLLSRRTHVPWSGQKLTAEQVSRVLRDANIPLVKRRRAAEEGFRDDPSALMWNIYGDLETYFIAYDVAGVEPGIYHYDPRDHALGQVAAGDFREKVRDAFVGQERAGSGSCSVLISAVWERHMFRYAGNPRGYRTMMMLIGQFAQRYLVSWTALGYTTFPTPAHYPELTDALIGSRRYEESGIYLITAG